MFFAGLRSTYARVIPIGKAGWLEVKKLQGKVIYQRQQVRQIAWNGLRLKHVGEILETQAESGAILALDQGIGIVHVAENTRFQIKTLHTTAKGGRVTLLEVTQGQVRMKVRPMKNPASRLEIHTPAGIAGVRGTEFGVSVQPSGKTGIATLSGRVDAEAQGETVAVGKALQSLTMPQEPPQPAAPLRDDPDVRLDLARLDNGQLRLVGDTDAVNVLLVNGSPQSTDRTGHFEIDLPFTTEKGNIELRVITPLGTQKRYELPIVSG